MKLNSVLIENAWIMTSNNYELGKKLQKLNRKELIELIVRLCFIWVLEMYGYGRLMSDYIEEFFMIYVE